MQSVQVEITRENLEEVHAIVEAMNWHQSAIREIERSNPMLLDVFLDGRSIVAPENMDPVSFEAFTVFSGALKEATRA